MGLLDSIDAEKEYPLRVRYPHGGWLHLLVWYAEHEGNNLIAAVGGRNLLKVYAARLKKENGDAKPVACWDAKLVCPPARVREAAAKAALKRDFEHVTGGVGWRLKLAYQKDPQAFAKEFPNVTPCKRRLKDKEHYDCPACLQGMAVEGHTRESFYLAKRNDPDREGPRTGLGSPARSRREEWHISRAPEADLSLPVYAVVEEFGHHCRGISIQVVDLKSEWLGGYGRDTKFFFQGFELAVPPEAMLMHKQYIDKWAAAEEKRKDEFRAQRTRDEQENFDNLKRLIT